MKKDFDLTFRDIGMDGLNDAEWLDMKLAENRPHSWRTLGQDIARSLAQRRKQNDARNQEDSI